MEKSESWKEVKTEAWKLGGTVTYYDVGSNKDYVMWHNEQDCFMAWIRKDVV